MAAVEVESGRSALINRSTVLVEAGLALMLVLVVAEMPGRFAGFMPAINCRCCPAELERQQGEQEHGEPTAHGKESSSYRV
ncbi:hypothetical protein RA210_U10429 [Rubrivivax sp. A210]|nr:hypothetical protein [Rubrivivax sp. A210]CAD5366646.1 hypothetical protein RA210_U10429 [Rubrivivax sp. A210]